MPARRPLTWLVAFALVGAACSAAAPALEPEVTTTVTTTNAPVENGEADVTTTVSLVPAKTPQYGGTLVYGLEADSLNPWTPQNTAPAASGHMVLRSVFDMLALPTIDLEVKGYLLTAIEPNADFTEWTLEVRPGITFHDGTPLDATAVADNLNRHRQSFISGNLLADVASVDVTSDMTVVVTSTRPWVSVPAVLTSQVGYVASPTWLAEVDADPAKALEPVGTGPFIFEAYTPGVSFRAVRNPDYWREGLPYLDAVEFRVLRGIGDRSQALLDGEANIIHTANGDEIAKFRGRLGSFNMVESAEFGETTYVLINLANPLSPVSDIRIRRAMALALDYELIKTARNGDLFEVPNGPFPPGAVGYLEDSGFPTYDPDAARALVEEWEAENGPAQITFTTTSDEFNLISAELYAQYWEAVGIDVQLVTIDQSEYIGLALAGAFETYFWRLHSGFDPDEQHVWWHSRNAREIGTVGLNFSRITDPVIDEALDTIRTTADEEVRREAAERINRRFAEQVYNIWLGWAVWGIISAPEVQDVITNFTLPDGDLVLPTGVGIGGTHQLAQIWIDPDA